MNTWFEDKIVIDTPMSALLKSVEQLGTHYLNIVKQMPGLTHVTLLTEQEGEVVLETNEGKWQRTGIVQEQGPERVSIKSHETYVAGKVITVEADFEEAFTVDPANDKQVLLSLTITNVHASGFLGFFYKLLGKKSIGNGLLTAHKKALSAGV